ncbi:MAG: M67 family metallopeptidase [Methanosarcinaceae archaeon]|nr:M67 family metallopeptidase [Methanosarcinaceae archaeon]MDF1533129.1 M67 family metallopeptidase [Methanosarcinaceae archaeon]
MPGIGIRISKNDITLIFDELENNRPFEACGVLVGSQEGEKITVSRVVPVKNSNRTGRSFELDPTEFYNAWSSAEKEGLDIVGVYHTHPVSPAKPSAWDKDTMQNTSDVWVIAGIDGIFTYRMAEGMVETVEMI